MQKLSMEKDSHLYVAKITNISKDSDITDYIDSCNITLPKANEISSMEANFILDEKLVDTGNEVKNYIYLLYYKKINQRKPLFLGLLYQIACHSYL